MESLILKRPDGDKLIVMKERSSNALSLATLVLFILLWYAALVKNALEGGNVSRLFTFPLVICLFIPLLFIPTLRTRAKAAFSQVSFVFDRKTQSIMECDKKIALFLEIEKVELRERRDSDGSQYVVNLIFQDGRKKKIEISYDANIIPVAQAIAEHIKRPYSYRD